MSKQVLNPGFAPNISINAATGCWEWMLSKTLKGYGQLRVHGRLIAAHRASYQLFCGRILKGMCVCHRCDNPSCINPDHLFLGTNADNTADMVAKGRGWTPDARGSDHYAAKITEADVVEIRAAKGVKLKELAKRYGVTVQSISLIQRGLTWRHVGFGAKNGTV